MMPAALQLSWILSRRNAGQSQFFYYGRRVFSDLAVYEKRLPFSTSIHIHSFSARSIYVFYNSSNNIYCYLKFISLHRFSTDLP